MSWNVEKSAKNPTGITAYSHVYLLFTFELVYDYAKWSIHELIPWVWLSIRLNNLITEQKKLQVRFFWRTGLAFDMEDIKQLVTFCQMDKWKYNEKKLRNRILMAFLTKQVLLNQVYGNLLGSVRFLRVYIYWFDWIIYSRYS